MKLKNFLKQFEELDKESEIGLHFEGKFVKFQDNYEIKSVFVNSSDAKTNLFVFDLNHQTDLFDQKVLAISLIGDE